MVGSRRDGGARADRDRGGYTFYVQQESPGADKESNCLPAPAGPFALIERLYWPEQAALDGTWKAPPPEKVAKSSRGKRW